MRSTPPSLDWQIGSTLPPPCRKSRLIGRRPAALAAARRPGGRRSARCRPTIDRTAADRPDVGRQTPERPPIGRMSADNWPLGGSTDLLTSSGALAAGTAGASIWPHGERASRPPVTVPVEAPRAGRWQPCRRTTCRRRGWRAAATAPPRSDRRPRRDDGEQKRQVAPFLRACHVARQAT